MCWEALRLDRIDAELFRLQKEIAEDKRQLLL